MIFLKVRLRKAEAQKHEHAKRFLPLSTSLIQHNKTSNFGTAHVLDSVWYTSSNWLRKVKFPPLWN